MHMFRIFIVITSHAFQWCFWMLLAVQRLRYVLQTSTSALPYRTTTAPATP